MFRAWMRHEHWVIWFTGSPPPSFSFWLWRRSATSAPPNIFERAGRSEWIAPIAHGIANQATTVMIRARAAITMIAHSVTQIANGTRRFRCMFGQIKRGEVFYTTQKTSRAREPACRSAAACPLRSWGVVGHGAFCPIDSGQGRAYIAARYAYRSAFHRALCLPTVRAGGPPRGQEDWGQGRL